eukprot:gene8236-12712_t
MSGIQSKGKQATTQLFQKNLRDIVEGIRKHKKNEQDYIQKVLQDIKEELKHRDIHVKVIAVQKMTYLHMIGYNMEYGAFTIIEVMSSQEDFSHKRIGYLACAQCFHDKVEMVQLLPNLLRNAVKSSNQWEQGIALSCLSNICTPGLAEILVSEVANLLTSQRPYIRKKCLLTLFKIFLQYPQALRPCFPRIKEKLDDPDPSVTAAAVNVICELARKNPKNYLGMAPVFFKLFANIQNNWTLIKIVKVFNALAPEEPRLPKKLAEPLTQRINTTPAKSLLYECLLAVASNAKSDTGLLTLAVEKLKAFVEDQDQNLKYLGLKGLARVMESSPQLLAGSKDLIIECLGDDDPSIRVRALDLVGGLVSKRNLHNVIGKMQEQMMLREEDDYRNTLVKYIIDICRQHNYAFVTNFEWYLRVLMDLTQSSVLRFEHGELLAEELMRVIVRVKAVQSFGVKCMCSLLCNPLIYQKADDPKSTLCRVLHAACFLASEYVKYIPNKTAVVQNMMRRRILTLPADIQCVAIQACLKIYAYVANPEDYEAEKDSDDDEDEEETLPEDDSKLEQIREAMFPDVDKAEENGKTHEDDDDSRGAEEEEESEEDGSYDSSDSSAVRKRKAKASKKKARAGKARSQQPQTAPAAQKEEELPEGLAMFLASCDVDVHEHSASVRALLDMHWALLQEGEAPALSTFFKNGLRSVKPGAQEHIELQTDLDTQIVDYVPQFSDDESEATLSSSTASSSASSDEDWDAKGKGKKKSKARVKAEEERQRVAAELARKNNPHYLGSAPSPTKPLDTSQKVKDDDLPPVEELTVDLGDLSLGTKGFVMKQKKDKKKRHKMLEDEEGPEGYEYDHNGKKKVRDGQEADREGVWNELDQDLNGPVKDTLPTMKPYERKDASDILKEQERKKRKEAKKEAGSDSDDDANDKKKKKKKNKKDKTENDASEEAGKDKKKKKAARLEEPDEEETTSMFSCGQAAVDVHVLDCKRKKKKGTKGKLEMDVKVIITNTGKVALRSLALKVKDPEVEVSAGEGFKISQGAVSQTADGHVLKVGKGESLTILLTLELTEVQDIEAMVSFSTKEVPETHTLTLVTGHLDAMSKLKKEKATRQLFFTTMQEMNDSEDKVVSKVVVDVDGGMEAALHAIGDATKMSIVEVLDSCAALMGQYVTPKDKFPVCMLVKATSSSQVQMELKTTAEPEVAEALLEAVENLFTHSGRYTATSSPARKKKKKQKEVIIDSEEDKAKEPAKPAKKEKETETKNGAKESEDKKEKKGKKDAKDKAPKGADSKKAKEPPKDAFDWLDS